MINNNNNNNTGLNLINREIERENKLKGINKFNFTTIKTTKNNEKPV
jgi:hypothetical protein